MPCNRMVSDRMGEHAFLCGNDSERITRHNHMRHVLLQVAVQAGLGPSREPDGMLPGLLSGLLTF